MITIQRILHATDFSPIAKTAFRYAARLAHKLNVPLHVIHVLPGIGPSRFQDVDVAADDRTNRDDLRHVLAEFRELGTTDIPENVNVRYMIGRGVLPGPVILEEAAHAESNIIVIGAHGQRAGETPFLGSVAAELMRRSTCPVFMVPSSVNEGTVDEEIETVLTFVSFSHLVQPVIQFALQLARLFEARLDVLAITEAQVKEEAGAVSSETTRKLEQQLWRILESHCLESGDMVPAESIRLHLQSESNAESILRFAQDQGSDLVIVDSPGLGSVESPLQWMLERIVNQSPCPVVLVNTCGKSFGQRSTTKMHNREAYGVS